MTGAPDQVVRWRGSDIARWSLSAVAILTVHAGAAAYLVTREPAGAPPNAPTAIILADMLPEVSSPPVETTEMPPGPEMQQTEEVLEKLAAKHDDEEATTEALKQPQPEPEPEALKPPEPEPEAPPAPLAPKPEVAVAPPREPEPPVEAKPVENKPIKAPKRAQPKKKPPKKFVPATTAPPPSQTARAQSAPVATASLRPSNAVPAWQNTVRAMLQRNLRHPAAHRGVEGLASVRITVGRSGQLISASLSRSAGDGELDREAVSLARRVAPYPPLPPEIRGASYSVTVPIRFNVR